MQITIFGPGCAKCEEAMRLVQKVVQENGIPATVTKVSDFKDMMRFGIMSTPAVAIDGVVKCTGRVPSASELLGWLSPPNTTVSAPISSGAPTCCCGGKC